MIIFKVAFSLISYIKQSSCSTLDWVMNSQSESTLSRFWLAVHHHWKFPINKKTILMLTCPIENVLLKHLLTTIQVIVTRFIFIDISFICCQVGEAPTTSPTAICIMQAVLTNAVWPSTSFWLILYTKCIHEQKFLLFLLLASC